MKGTCIFGNILLLNDVYHDVFDVLFILTSFCCNRILVSQGTCVIWFYAIDISFSVRESGGGQK